jgi:hypothetical protein
MNFLYVSIQQQQQQYNSGGWENNKTSNSNDLYVATDHSTNKKLLTGWTELGFNFLHWQCVSVNKDNIKIS